ncbi:nucleoside phosphorylase domain-containing protein [Aspergillus bertholletiae]|uniref:Nucleoside phosphorylase domain-containing protein n=1 Tax=Aspergillus bertholletiae TaxID=1226010 RepID=A0A5N7AYX3_9EURO|nr:nucleoside phosphorylase domain-containing protein [Aspergillus bertholletiae]
MIQLKKHEYTVGWICALPSEMAAATAMLDETHAEPAEQHPQDPNSYCLGRIGRHNVVVACLPAGVYGTTSAATAAAKMISSFPSVNLGLMVGIGGGVPSAQRDIRLGDVVSMKDGIVPTGSLNKPPQILLTTIASLEATHMKQGSKIPTFLSEMTTKFPQMEEWFSCPGREHDLLFEADYFHGHGATCEQCDAARLLRRTVRVDQNPVIHYGTIASGNQVIKNGITRDRLRDKYGILCFEMEAAGLMDNFPCLVIRGICDYADTHKNKCWQKYAVVTAAAYGKELLCSMPQYENQLPQQH